MTVKSITAIEKMARTISDAADKQHANADRLVEATNVIHQAASMLGKSVAGFGGTLRMRPGCGRQTPTSGLGRESWSGSTP